MREQPLRMGKRRATGTSLARVCALSNAATRGTFRVGARAFPCALGRAGRRASKREGDGATPFGRLALVSVLYRADRLRRPRTGIPVAAIRPWDGWCDAAGDRNYNARIRHPYRASAEKLWRDDALYDILVVLDYNIRPRRQGRGSAIFLHVAAPGLSPTEGCIALRIGDLEKVLQMARRGTMIVA